MEKFKYIGGAIVSCAACGKYPDYDEDVLLMSEEEFRRAKNDPCPPHKLIRGKVSINTSKSEN